MEDVTVNLYCDLDRGFIRKGFNMKTEGQNYRCVESAGIQLTARKIRGTNNEAWRRDRS